MAEKEPETKPEQPLDSGTQSDLAAMSKAMATCKELVDGLEGEARHRALMKCFREQVKLLQKPDKEASDG